MSQFRKEYLEQPLALKNTLENFLISNFRDNANIMKSISNKNISNILITGMGSSFYAGYFLANYLNSNQIPAYVVEATDLAYFGNSQIRNDTLVVAISRGGESDEIKEALKYVNKDNFVLAITEEDQGYLASHSNGTFYTYGGDEIAPTTKSFLCTLGVSLLFADWLIDGRILKEKSEKLLAIPNLVESILDDEDKIFNLTNKFKIKSKVNVLGRGLSYAIARQSGLIFKEEAGIAAEGLSTNDFQHGHIFALSDEHLIVMLSNSGLIGDLDDKLILKLKDKKGDLLLISDYLPPNHKISHYLIPSVEKHLSPMLQIIAIEIMLENLKPNGKSNYLDNQ